MPFNAPNEKAAWWRPDFKKPVHDPRESSLWDDIKYPVLLIGPFLVIGAVVLWLGFELLRAML